MCVTENRKRSLADEVDGGATLNKDFLTISELKEIISETALTEVDRTIAVMRYIDSKSVQEIASEIGYDERTVRRRLCIIGPKLCETLLRIVYS